MSTTSSCYFSEGQQAEVAEGESQTIVTAVAAPAGKEEDRGGKSRGSAKKANQQLSPKTPQ